MPYRAWSIIEAALFREWKDYLDKCKQSGIDISAKRTDKLTGRDFTASVVQETLNLAGVLTNNDYAEIDEVRKARNNWIH